MRAGLGWHPDFSEGERSGVRAGVQRNCAACLLVQGGLEQGAILGGARAKAPEVLVSQRSTPSLSWVKEFPEYTI